MKGISMDAKMLICAFVLIGRDFLIMLFMIALFCSVKGASEGRKRFNDRNSEILLQQWGKEIRSQESVDDQFLHAKNYLYRGILRPFSTNIFKWIEALLIYCRIKRLQ